MPRSIPRAALLIFVLGSAVGAAPAVRAGLQAAPAADWRDWPATQGTWAYRQDARGSIALFGRYGEPADLTIRCDRGRGQVYLSRRGEPPADAEASLTIRTTSTTRSFAALPTGGTPAYLAIALGVRDPILDAMGYSRGRFTVEAAGLPTLVVPAWAEILRVTEDCRA
ncbi:MAG: hypothetical protein WDN44_02640 [Sphingomonas sp.]